MTDAAHLEGSDFRAVKRLSNAADDTLADVGGTCERVPVESLPGLLAHGLIEAVTPAPPTEAPVSVDPEEEQPF